MSASIENQERLNPARCGVELIALSADRNRIDGCGQTEGLIDPQLSPASQSVLKRYIQNGLNVARQAPSRAEKIARGIAYEARNMTWEKAGNTAKNAAAAYVKNVNPLNFIREDLYWKGGAFLGMGLGTILTVTGARFNPLIRTSISFGISVGFQTLAEIDYKNAVKKLDRLNLSEEEKKAKLAELEPGRDKARKITKGMSAGFAYLGFNTMAGMATQDAAINYFVNQGADQTDWPKIGDVFAPATAYAAESKPPPVPTSAPASLIQYAAEDASARIKPGYELVVEAFGDPSVKDPVTGEQSSSIVGKAKAIIAEYDYKIKGFDPSNVDHLKLLEAESQADASAYSQKIKAVVNEIINLNQDKMDAFIDKNGVIGNTYSYAYENDEAVKFKTYKDWSSYFSEGEYRNDINGPVEPVIVNEGYKQTVESFKGTDPVYKNLTKQALGLQDSPLEPGQVSSVKGLAEAWYAEDYLGIKGFDPSNEEHMAKFWEATAEESPAYDPLSKLRIQKIAETFISNNDPEAFLRDKKTGELTDLFRRVEDDNISPVKLKTLANNYDLAASLVNEGPVGEVMGPDSPWVYAPLEQDSSLDGLAQAIFYQQDLGVENFDAYNASHLEEVNRLIAEKYGNDPGLMEKKLKAIKRLILETNPELYFDGDRIVAKSGLTGRANVLKLLKNLKPILEAIK